LRKVVLYLYIFSSFIWSSTSYEKLVDSINHELKKIDNIATTTKSNEHYQPSIVTVLEHKRLVELGCKTLLDAIKLAPNVDISSDNIAYKSVIFRGSNPTSFGQSKLFIDGILVNNIYFDGYSEYLDMPIELIKRVEIIRGPGNKENTVPSYAGSIRVITYAEDMKKNSYFFQTGDYNHRVAGFTKSFTKSKLKVFTDFFYKKDDKYVNVNSDALASGIFDFPSLGIDNSDLSSSAKVPLYHKEYSLGVSLKYEDFYLKSRLYSYKQGSAFGLNYIPAPFDDEDYLKTPNHYIVTGYKKSFEDKSIDIKVGYNYNALDTKSKLAPEGLELPSLSDPTKIVTYTDGVYGENIAKQENIYHSLTYTYKGIKKHFFNFEYYFGYTHTKDVVSKITNRDTGSGIVDYSDIFPFFDKNAHRETYIFNLSDKYYYRKDIQFLYSLNYENNSHIDPKLEPKLSVVYVLNEENIIKLLYAKSHRTPSWQELYTINNYARLGNPNLKAERIETYEASYIKHFSNDNYIQSSLFYIINSNQIHNNTPDNMYINTQEDNKLYGLELELKSNLTPKDMIHLNFSYTDGENTPEHTLALVSKVLAKGQYTYNIKENFTFSTIVTYESSKERLPDDDRDKIKPTITTDISLNYKQYKTKSNINLSIKNLFNEKEVYPSKPGTYQEDYPQVGRTFVLSYTKRF